MIFDAFYPAALADGAELITHDASDDVTLRFPKLTAARVAEVCSALRTASQLLRSRSAHEIIAAIDAAAAELADPGSDLGLLARALIPRITRYSPPMVDLVLQHMTADWSARALHALVAAELGSAARLDGFVDDGFGRRIRAFGPALAAHIFSGNVPGVAVTSLIRALLVKAPSFGKTAREEPVLPVLFARALEHADPGIAAALAVTYWTGGDQAIEQPLFEQADAVVVYGGRDAVESVHRYMRPDQRLIVHGPRFSIGAVHRSALDDDTAKNIASAVAAFDQQGCVSPHVVYLVGAQFEDARAFAERITRELTALEGTLPRGPLAAEEAVRMQNARARAEFAGIAGRNIVMTAGAAHTIVVDANPAFEPSCLNRFLYVKPIESGASLVHEMEPFANNLQSVALAGFPEAEAEKLVAALGANGATRFTSFAALPWPPPHWHHDGSSPLLELVRWADWEHE